MPLPESEPWVTLREYLERRLDDVSGHLEAKFITLENRLDGMNEIRQQLAAQAGTFLTLATYDAKHEALVARLNVLESKRALAEGQSRLLIGLLFTVVGLVLGAFIIQEFRH